MATLSWAKDRTRSLGKRAIAEEIQDQQQISAFQRKPTAVGPTKAELRLVAEQVVQQNGSDRKGSWLITCECGHAARVTIEFSIALKKPFRCTGCNRKHRLTEADLEPPWD